jgi:hypothetical protein
MDETDAEVIKMALAAEGIPSFIENANQAGLAGCIPVRVQVPAGVAERAKTFVAKHEQSGGHG